MERKECVVVGAGLAGLAAAYRLTQEKRTILLRLHSRNSRTGLWKTLPTPTPYRGAQVKVVTALDIKQQPWQKEFFIGGAYAFYRPGQWFALRPELREPFQRVFFCWGTYCRLAGLMEGAVVTGKAAAAVLRY